MLPLMSRQVNEFTAQARVGPCLYSERKNLMAAMKRMDEHADVYPSPLYRSVGNENDSNMHTRETRRRGSKKIPLPLLRKAPTAYLERASVYGRTFQLSVDRQSRRFACSVF